MRFKAYTVMSEALYHGNIGFAEMVQFYRQASDNEIKEMEAVVRHNDWASFKALIKKVLGISLK